MRIGVVSDSHGNISMLDKAISRMGDVDLIIHLGDFYYDILKVNEKYKKAVEYVVGNNEFVMNPIYDRTIVLGGKTTFITHGHKYGVYYGIDRLYFKAQEVQADIVLYGHTHIQSLVREGGMVFLNPGSVSRPRDSKAGYAVIEIDESGDIDVNLLRLDY